ncbi:MAG: sigma-70 family RNA polymerase sigma factor [Oscillospiraceae bacterium]|nr:sigma-70 family RNA polymerase sigma factor [Oscillospiraceae bacterium]
MTKINLREFYPRYYNEDCFAEVSVEVAAELLSNKRYEETYSRTIRREKVYSLDMDDGTETAAFICSTDNPEAVIEMMERHCGLCRALNSLPEIQGQRIDAHYLIGISQQEIANAEGVTKGSVSISIARGLKAMRKFLNKN